MIAHVSERIWGFPPHIDQPLYLFEHDAKLKAHPAYVAAKAGGRDAAVQLVADLAQDFIIALKNRQPENAIYLAPFANEATGDNAIPMALAAACATMNGSWVEEDIVQITRVYHTGADPMERLSARPRFEGAVHPDGQYVLVDDVISMGGTLAELANFIQVRGGKINHIIVLVNAGRDKRLNPSKQQLATLERRYHHEIRSIFGIHVSALTANEASYLIGFRSADEIRNRRAKAEKETALRLRTKGIQREV